MKRTTLNFIINAIMFICMAAIAGIGFLIKYTLISGQERRLVYDGHVELYVLGMDRHQWGDIHLILGYVLLGLLMLHIILHWNMVVCVFNRMFKNKPTNKLVAIAFATICALFIIVPFFTNPEVHKIERGEGVHATNNNRANKYGRNDWRNSGTYNEKDTKIDAEEGNKKDNTHRDNTQKKGIGEKRVTGEGRGEARAERGGSAGDEGGDEKRGMGMGKGTGNRKNKFTNTEATKLKEHANTSVIVKGYMTLDEIAATYNVPNQYIKTKLKIPQSISGKQKLGWLRNNYNISMKDVEDAIIEYGAKNK